MPLGVQYGLGVQRCMWAVFSGYRWFGFLGVCIPSAVHSKGLLKEMQ